MIVRESSSFGAILSANYSPHTTYIRFSYYHAYSAIPCIPLRVIQAVMHLSPSTLYLTNYHILKYNPTIRPYLVVFWA